MALHPIFTESGITSAGTPSTVSVANNAWTALPAATSLNGRTGLFVTNPPTNTAAMFLSISPTAPAYATTIGPLCVQPGMTFFVNVSSAVKCYGVTLAAGAENAHVQEVTQ